MPEDDCIEIPDKYIPARESLPISDILSHMGRTSLGPEATPGNGNCLFLSFLQTRNILRAEALGEPWFTRLSDNDTNDAHQLRRHSANLLTQSPTLRTLLTPDACRSVMDGMDGDCHAVTRHVKQNGVWAHDIIVRALAIFTNTHIVTVRTTDGVITWFPSHEGGIYTNTATGKLWNTGTNCGIDLSTYDPSMPYVPDIVYNSDTVVVCYAPGHFWCTSVNARGNLDGFLDERRTLARAAGVLARFRMNGRV